MKVKAAPDIIYSELFEEVQSSRVFDDSKTFVDAVARSDPAEILADYRAARGQPGFDLRGFVDRHFELPADDATAATVAAGVSIEDRIEQLWDVLAREADRQIQHSSLIPLPNRYIVPGGRFREVYYWDSYFTMLGLAESGRIDLISSMVDNFAYLIDEVGFIPNGNRTYYCSRSQPPFFALMVELLADASGDDTVYARYLPHLKREYSFWMAGADTLSDANPAHRRVVLGPSGILNRFWDDVAIPRQESYAEDVELAAGVSRDAASVYRDIRAGAESGWDFSPRWFEDKRTMQTIRTTQIVPVDLNALMYNLESLLARVCRSQGDDRDAEYFKTCADTRKTQLQDLFFDEVSGMFMDLSLHDFSLTGTLSLAAAYPLYFGVATAVQASRVAGCIHRDFLKAGGWVTSNYDSGQQWDSPNGWAPLQWITWSGLRRYGYHDEAQEGASRWVDDNIAVYRKLGRLLEKYNVESSGLVGTGGEYEVQDGFGWTNAVLLRLMREVATD